MGSTGFLCHFLQVLACLLSGVFDSLGFGGRIAVHHPQSWPLPLVLLVSWPTALSSPCLPTVPCSSSCTSQGLGQDSRSFYLDTSFHPPPCCAMLTMAGSGALAERLLAFSQPLQERGSCTVRQAQ